MKFTSLIASIEAVHRDMHGKAQSAINRALTIRNWLIGFYIVEFEQHGDERATYGERLVDNLADELKRAGIKGLSGRNLKLYRQFALAYPQIVQTASAQLPSGVSPTIMQTLSAQLQRIDSELKSGSSERGYLGLSPEIVIAKLSFSHLVELIKISEPLQRAFYEIECVKCGWSVRELKRQIESLLYERTGLAKDKDEMLRVAQGQNLQPQADHLMRDPYVFEFLGLRQTDLVPEDGLREAILDHLQAFILEMGKGFCFEAREQRILVDDEYYRIDLVFYHRILKCHVLIDLKTRKFSHTDAGQLNFYLNYYKDNEMSEGDNPPIGMLLCTDKQSSTVKYATGGMDNQLFISQYKVALPSEDQLVDFLERDKERIEEALARQASVTD